MAPSAIRAAGTTQVDLAARDDALWEPVPERVGGLPFVRLSLGDGDVRKIRTAGEPTPLSIPSEVQLEQGYVERDVDRLDVRPLQQRRRLAQHRSLL